MMGNKESRQVYASTYGLRSVPYLIFSATSMTETCALHLSYVVTHHGMPEQLLRYVPAAKAGAPAQQLQTYSHTAGCRGLIYDSNPSLGVAGMKVLDLAEIVRQHRFSDGDEDDKEGAFEAISPAARLRNKTRRISDTRRGSSAANHRFSNSSTGGTEYAYVSRENAVAELDRARSRIQGNALHEAGPCSNDLWHVALRMLNIGRIIRPISKREPPLLRTKRAEDVQSRGFGFGSPKHSTFSTTALAPKNPNQSINHNIGQWRLEDSKLVPVMAPEPASKKPSPPPSPHLMKPQNAPYKTQLPLGFSQEVWRRIIAFSVNANEILTENQQRSVMKWAMDRSTLNRERESLGLKQSAQIWKVLEGMECLAYEINT